MRSMHEVLLLKIKTEWLRKNTNDTELWAELIAGGFFFLHETIFLLERTADRQTMAI